jgi:aspartate racemase
MAVVVCNTAHILYERWGASPPIPVLHIVDETVRAASSAGARCVAPLVSASLAAHDLYGERAAAIGLPCSRLPPADQSVIDEAIASIKVSGNLGAFGKQAILDLFARLKAEGIDTVLAGCTELSILSGLCTSVGLRFIDSNEALARAALARLGVDEGLLRSPT